MSFDPEQAQYAELYFDLERAKTMLFETRAQVKKTLAMLTQVYLDERDAMEEGKKLPPRVAFDTATRAAITAQLALLPSLIGQIYLSCDVAQSNCQFFYPDLQHPSTVN